MDPIKRMTRPPADYLGRAVDPSGRGVHQAREQRSAEQFYLQPGARVPNNTLVGRGVMQELASVDNARVTENLYRDWRGQNLPGTGVNFSVQPPAWAWASRHATPPEGSNGVFDLMAGQKFMATTAPSPLPPAANPILADLGLAAQVARRPDGGPMGQPLPPTPAPGVEDLRFSVPVQVLGRPEDAIFPRARPGGGGSRGKSPRMPPPA